MKSANSMVIAKRANGVVNVVARVGKIQYAETRFLKKVNNVMLAILAPS